MKLNNQLIYKAMGLEKGSIIKINNGIYKLDNYLKHISGDDTYANKHILILFDREEDVIPYKNIVCCSDICHECPLNPLECQYDITLPEGYPLYTILDNLNLDPELYKIFKKRIEDYINDSK